MFFLWFDLGWHFEVSNCKIPLSSAYHTMKYLSLLPYVSHALSLRLAARSLATSQRMVVGYATDVEGNIDYWNQYLSVSKVLVKENKLNSVHRIKLKDSCHFVYGGDACDRGMHAIFSTHASVIYHLWFL